MFEAYFAWPPQETGTYNALAFEADYERKCIDLWRDINGGTYHPSHSVAFIVFKPVQREVFAADFCDRVMHHLIARKIEPLLEAQFIDDSYSSRREKGHCTASTKYAAMLLYCKKTESKLMIKY